MRANDPPTFFVAGFWRRLGAALIDCLVIVPLGLLLAWLAGLAVGIELPPSRHRGIDYWLDLALVYHPAIFNLVGLTCATAAIYLLVFQITQGRTLGMQLLRMRIIDIYGDSPSPRQSIARTLGYLINLATLSLGFLWIGFDAERRGLHDWIAGTYVVKT